MASLGDLVVNLTANTKPFQQGMKQSQQVLSNFQANAIIAAGAAGAIGLIKLAADAETLEVKFRVLLKSGQAASLMMQEIGRFAASTPFQKLDIADAAQKLLAFNVPARDVMGVLKNIGDISALTGNRIGELAELYGKANVQGRLFMEDINQLTGRGIPIIQELAKQFGVAESEVRGLVEAGKVSADNVARAFADMTGAGGQFADGMAQLSETTAGKFSTLKDNVIELGAAMGKELLPIANKLLTTAIGLVKNVAQFSKQALLVGTAIVAFAAAMRILNAALALYAQRQAIATALSGPKGWAKLAAGAAAAAVAVALLNETFAEQDTQMNQTVRDAQRTAAEFDTTASAASRLGDKSAAAAKDVADLAKAGETLDGLLQGMETDLERVARRVDEFTEALAASQRGIVWDDHPLIVLAREKETGFLDTFNKLNEELEVLRGEATETEIALRKMWDGGVGQDRLDELDAMFAERDRIVAGKEAAEEAKRFWDDHAADLQSQADKIKDALMSPAERLNQEKQRLQGLVDQGLLTQTQADNFMASQNKGGQQGPRNAGVMQRGSSEAMSAILNAMGGSNPQAQVVKAVDKVPAAVKQQTKDLQKEFKKIAADRANKLQEKV